MQPLEPRAHGISEPRAHGLPSSRPPTLCARGSGTPCARATQWGVGYPLRTGVRDPMHTGWSGAFQITPREAHILHIYIHTFRRSWWEAIFDMENVFPHILY